MTEQDIRVVLVGDDKSGKTSLIRCLICEEFLEQGLPPIMPEVTFLPEATLEKVPLHVVDTSSNPSDKAKLEQEIRSADVICVVYAVNQPTAVARIRDFWLPEIQRLGAHVPIILVGNKIDTRGADMNNPQLENEFQPLLNQYKELETVIECSAKEMLNVNEVFFFAQKAVLYPTPVLYDSNTEQLQAPCVKALERIFHLCDFDRDGALSDDEMDYFQERCFGKKLDPNQANDLKELVRKTLPEGVTRDGITLIGFVFLHNMLMQKGHPERVWTVLRKFGYANNITVRENFVYPKTFSVQEDTETCELSDDGIEFIRTRLFQRFDPKKTGSVSAADLESLFSMAVPAVNPFANQLGCVRLTDDQRITADAFVALWQMLVYVDHKLAMRYLATLGFEDNISNAVVKYNRRKNKQQRSVFQVFVFGSPDVGKTTLLDGLIGRQATSKYVPSTQDRRVIAPVTMKGTTRYLIMSEFNGPNREDELLAHGIRLANQCDLLVMMYSQSSLDSFKYLVSLEQRHKRALADFPRVYFANKADEKAEPFKNPSPQGFTSGLRGVPPPVSLSLDTPRGEQQQGLYVSICRAAIESPRSISGSTSLLGSPLRVILFGSALLGIGAAAYLAFAMITGAKPPASITSGASRVASSLSRSTKSTSPSASTATVSAGISPPLPASSVARK